MWLKWLPVRLRRYRRVLQVAIDFASVQCPATCSVLILIGPRLKRLVLLVLLND